MRARFLEVQSRTLEEVVCRRRYDDFVGTAERHDARGSVDGETTGVTTNQLDLTCVDTYPDRETNRARGSGHGGTATHGARGAVENREETVSGGFHLTPAKGVELVT